MSFIHLIKPILLMSKASKPVQQNVVLVKHCQYWRNRLPWKTRLRLVSSLLSYSPRRQRADTCSDLCVEMHL